MTKSRTPRPTQFSKESTKEFIRDSESGFYQSFVSFVLRGRLSFDATLFTAMARGLLSSLHPRETVSQCDNASSGHYDTVSDAADLRGGSCRFRYSCAASRIDLAMAPYAPQRQTV